MKSRYVIFLILIFLMYGNPIFGQNGNIKKINKLSHKPRTIKIIKRNQMSRRTNSVYLKNLKRNMNIYRSNYRRGSKSVNLKNIPSFMNRMKNMIKIDSLTLKESELPKDLIFARIPKFPENPALLREDRDLKRVSKEAFDLEVYWRLWDSINLTLMTDGLNESISYYIIAIKYKSPFKTKLEKSEIDHLKKYMKRIVGEESVILEKYPFIIIIASDMQGDDQFNNIKKLGKIMDKKLNPQKDKDLNKDAGTKEVTLIKNRKEIKSKKKSGGK